MIQPNKNCLPALASKWPRALRLFSCCLAFFLFNLSSFAQQTGRDISGKVVTSNGEPIEGATISVKGASGAVVSGSDGSFSIHIPENAILVISFVGYKEQEVNTAGLTEFNFTLMPSTQSMDDIVVVGYTAQRKSTITGAASSVNMADLSTRRVPDVGQLLQGSVAGVQVTQSTGAPGDGIEIRIRGNSTIGNNNPLYIVDGIPSREINFINPQDIESITVLKDAAASAIYGSRAASGVVVITTKGGKKVNLL
ncbi:TonB-dependent receptor plug domain-containing protein [Niabella hibiscisoli]|uniref:TonB-dependent receptor plug domain-containing protein n=1 Tax=Niabella hibiscisoli TaxID=1825928 RepID=UPI001F110A3A|nr:TonB-dependent receptor plug domain-containing protein [Niabella hibiscisoli]MCH5718674.1 TonB-dependent receptor plug domain-containing protein [Niabella hibiscisoli]